MPYPYKRRTRMKTEEIIFRDSEINLANITSPYVVPNAHDLPPGMFVIGAAVHGVGNDQDVVLELKPYIDQEQTIVGASFWRWVSVGIPSVATGNKSFLTVTAATTTPTGYMEYIVPGSDEYGAAAPVVQVFGSQLTITTTATTGLLRVTFTAVEW